MELCSRIVNAFGNSWGVAGWAFFVGWLILPWLTLSAGYYGLCWAGFGLLLLLWWVIDIVDQQVAVWKVLVGVLMLVISYIAPTMSAKLTFPIAAWVIYWTRVRE
jgi:hypothetical protein